MVWAKEKIPVAELQTRLERVWIVLLNSLTRVVFAYPKAPQAEADVQDMLCREIAYHQY